VRNRDHFRDVSIVDSIIALNKTNTLCTLLEDVDQPGLQVAPRCFLVVYF
jgi:hypothetical protein